MGMSSTRNTLIRFWILSPPKMRNRLSSKERKYRVLPGSPCRPARPRSWLSTLLLSCLSVPTTCRPPIATTSIFSAPVTFLNSASMALNAPRSARAATSVVGAFSHANESRSSASRASTDRSPHSLPAVAMASVRSACVAADSSQGNKPSFTRHLPSFPPPRFFFSNAMSPSSGITTRGMSSSLTRNRAMNSALPPSRISVPRPAMFVAIVTLPLRPDCATISLSRSTFSGLALRSS
mmetsp:Transcript_12445/g.41391  ORF Transcript_12445/g.41391 Transcript_12445/m.41391 type:complete len:237 (+) Transcript_12445:920-1630(+)